MRTIIATLLAIPLLAGCAGQMQYAVKTVIVDKPVLVCPAPPQLDNYDFEVSKLKPEDAKDPGKVAQAYKADMLYLRRMEGVYKDIIKKYSDAADEAAKARAEVDKIFQNNQEAIKNAQPTSENKPTQ